MPTRKRHELTSDEHKIVNYVSRVQGCKITQLATELYIIENLPSKVEKLVKDGWLVEVEYVLPNVAYRIKSFILPADTKVL